MSNLEKSIVKVLLESRGIYENHDDVVKKLNSSAGPDIGGETPNFVHGKGPNKDGPQNGTHDTPKHSSPVEKHFYHQGEFGGDGEHEHHITVSHHEDGSATVHHTAIRRKWSERDEDYDETSTHKETHHKTLNDAIDHVRKLNTPN
jgi:hypothetical protein